MGRCRSTLHIVFAAAALAAIGASAVRAGDAKPTDTRLGDARLGDSKLGDAKLSDPPAAAAVNTACAKSDFEGVVEEAAGSLRDLNAKNKPSFQEKLRSLKTKRGWSNDQFMSEAAPFVRDDKIAEFDTATEELLSAISSMGQEGAAAASPDCAVLLELRARMKVLVDTQVSKWAYMFQKLDTELWK